MISSVREATAIRREPSSAAAPEVTCTWTPPRSGARRPAARQPGNRAVRSLRRPGVRPAPGPWTGRRRSASASAPRLSGPCGPRAAAGATGTRGDRRAAPGGLRPHAGRQGRAGSGDLLTACVGDRPAAPAAGGPRGRPPCGIAQTPRGAAEPYSGRPSAGAPGRVRVPGVADRDDTSTRPGLRAGPASRVGPPGGRARSSGQCRRRGGPSPGGAGPASAAGPGARASR